MTLRTDDDHGRSIGSHIWLSGKVFGKPMALEEVVTRREPPHIKAWETVGIPNFLIVGQYRYSVDIKSQDEGSLLHVAFDFSPPKDGGRLRLFLSERYAKTCAREMTRIARNHFSAKL